MSGEELWFLSTVMVKSAAAEVANSTANVPVTVLIKGAMEDAYRSRVAVLPFCPLIREYMFAHPVYLTLIPETWRARFPPLGPAAGHAAGKGGNRRVSEPQDASMAARRAVMHRAQGVAPRVRMEPVRKRAAQRATADARRRELDPDPTPVPDDEADLPTTAA
ncbi:hypothetical protein IV498_15890 [Paenarthrobacter sp. Z7-10]|uniref:hypothetical protein n=1 Tax=Paenarthrobacter sp. Z7-10 TaxID=2787635 RepID=UPI0022A9D2D3|nr:hypothetical protein [Paenarthrobacter sp. Z7-10]MCZ2404619.1 hypothetical protein [Paenarthrobacter sp. Z7-10]